MTETQRAAMQQALDILDSEFSSVDGEICRWCDGRLLSKRHNCKLEQTIAALSAALAEPEPEPAAKVELMTTGGNVGLATRIVEIYDPLRERLRPGQLLYTTPPAAFDSAEAMRLADDYASAQSQLDGEHSMSRKYYVESRDEARVKLAEYLGIKEAK